eukprot:755602-Hanusia_phi.AAC.3
MESKSKLIHVESKWCKGNTQRGIVDHEHEMGQGCEQMNFLIEHMEAEGKELGIYTATQVE